MIIVTGAAGFIGVNLVRELREQGKDVVLVDYDVPISAHLPDDLKNLTTWNPNEFLDVARSVFLSGWYATESQHHETDHLGREKETIEAVIHLGACTDTLEKNPHIMMTNNFEYSRKLFLLCQECRIPLIYASSAAVYGTGPFTELSTGDPLNLYAKSKLLLDNYIGCYVPVCKSPVVGLRFFNVYGPGEDNKGNMASTIHKWFHQIKKGEKPTLFDGSHVYSRDFVYVDDVVDAIIHFVGKNITGIFNIGTGYSEPFTHIIYEFEKSFDFECKIIPFPIKQIGVYQTFTQADLRRLRKEANYTREFRSLSEGIAAFVKVQNYQILNEDIEEFVRCQE